MKLFLIEREEWDYDEYGAFVVAAVDINDARVVVTKSHTWPVEPSAVQATYLGTAKPGTQRGTILGSFNAG